jgi:DNA-binding MarR family transcriptional regulator
MKQTRWLTPAEQELWRSFLFAQMHLDRLIGADLSTGGLSHADYAVLVALTEGEPEGLRVGALRDFLDWESSRLAHQLRRMERRGLVRRKRAADDGRGTIVRATDEGRARIVAAAPGHVETVRRHFVDLLDEEEREVVRRVCDRIRSIDEADSGILEDRA